MVFDIARRLVLIKAGYRASDTRFVRALYVLAVSFFAPFRAQYASKLARLLRRHDADVEFAELA